MILGLCCMGSGLRWVVVVGQAVGSQLDQSLRRGSLCGGCDAAAYPLLQTRWWPLLGPRLAAIVAHDHGHATKYSTSRRQDDGHGWDAVKK